MKQFLFACVFAGAAAGTASAQEDPTGWWTDETSAFYFARGGYATDGSYLYLFGGYQLGVSSSYPSYYRRARRYDPVSNAWLTLANLPIVESGITYQYNASACFGGLLYSFGTSYEDGNGIVLTYSIADDAWTVLTGVTVPDSRYGAAAAVLDDLIYVSGGFSGSPSRRVDAFDPADNTFTRVADLPTGLHLHAMAAVPARGSLFVVGGMSADGYEAGCYEYSPSANAWTERSPIAVDGALRPRGTLAAFTLRNRIYAAGGRSNSGALSTVFEYQPSTDTWTPRASMASARYQHAAVAINGRGYVYGGLPVYDEGEEFTPPDFGPAPELGSPVAVSGKQPESALQATEDPSKRDGWTDPHIGFSAVITDPDPADFVRLRIRIRRPGEPLWTEIESGLVGQGLVALYYTLPTPGSYDWEYRIEDVDDNSFPAEVDAWIPSFGNDRTPDLRCDAADPSAPLALRPAEQDVAVVNPDAGDVTFEWSEGTDNGPVAGLVHDIELSPGEDFAELEASLTVPAGTGRTTHRLAVSSAVRYWRVRARDIAGNVSAWSGPLRFRVTHDDRIDHAGGDGGKMCFFGAVPVPAAGVRPVLLALLLAAGSLLHSRARRHP